MLGRLYYKIWHDLCRRPEPFTETIRRLQREAPLLFILGAAGLGICLGHLFW